MGIFLIALVLNSWVENINLLMAIIIMLTACVFATLLLSGGKKNLRSVSTPEI
jgi:hypothetical protein